jgi:2-haloacid dehalogenase
LEQGHQLVSGAFALITELNSQFDLYIVTNGVSSTQDKRLRASGLYPLFKDIFISEDTGFQKPMKEFFDYVFERIPHFEVNQALIIGDSLSADILGGDMAGMDTCWFNPQMKPNSSTISPTYIIHKLEELKLILSVRDRIGAC